MKSLLIFLSILIGVGLYTRADAPAPKQKYTIKAIKPATGTVTLRGSKKPLRIGGVISGDGKIDWSRSTAKYVRVESPNRTSYVLSAKAFQGKNASQTIDQFFLNSTPMSTRGNSVNFLAGQNKDKFPERRLALVIGNSNYLHLSTLRNAQGDALDMAETLSSLGFDVLEAYECTKSDFEAAVKQFALRAKDYDIAMFYYSGHGTQSDKEKNYLIPITSDLNVITDITDNCVSCDKLIEVMEDSGVKERVIYIDACRSIPHSLSRSSRDDLAPMEAFVGTVIMFSTQSGKVAYDGEEGDNSPFAKALMKNMVKPNVEFAAAMKRVVADTYKLTKHSQTPSRTGDLLSDFTFSPQVSTPINSSSRNIPCVIHKTTPFELKRMKSHPRVEFDDKVFISIDNVRREGDDILVTLDVINNSSKIYRPGLPVFNYAYDNRQEEYYILTIDKKGAKDEGVVWEFAPKANVSVKSIIRIPNFSKSATEISQITLSFYVPDKNEYWHMNIYDLPIDFDGRKDPKYCITYPNIEVDAGEMYVDNVLNVGVMSVWLRNTSEDYIEAQVFTGGKLNSESSMIYRQDGTKYYIPWENVETSIGEGGDFRLLPNSWEEIKIFIEDVSKVETYLPRVRIGLRVVNKDVAFGKARLDLYNIPISRK